MGKNSRERIAQKSAGLKGRQIDFIHWAELNLPEFDWNKLVRDTIENQIEILAPQFLEEK